MLFCLVGWLVIDSCAFLFGWLVGWLSIHVLFSVWLTIHVPLFFLVVLWLPNGSLKVRNLCVANTEKSLK